MDKKEIKIIIYTWRKRSLLLIFILGSEGLSLDLVKACVEKAGARDSLHWHSVKLRMKDL